MADATKSRKAALGFRTHSGWAVAVLAAGRGERIEILDRRHVALCDSAKEGTKQPFHAAEAMPFAQAQSHIALCRKTSTAMAREAISSAIAICEGQKLKLSGVCVITASGRALPALAAILASHALIHSAEGEFYRDAVAGAANTAGLTARRLKQVDALGHVSAKLDLGETALSRRLIAIGKTVGRPWTSDEKLATLAAWSLLIG
jgi:hypothetical protein